MRQPREVRDTSACQTAGRQPRACRRQARQQQLPGSPVSPAPIAAASITLEREAHGVQVCAAPAAPVVRHPSAVSAEQLLCRSCKSPHARLLSCTRVRRRQRPSSAVCAQQLDAPPRRGVRCPKAHAGVQQVVLAHPRAAALRRTLWRLRSVRTAGARATWQARDSCLPQKAA